MLNTRKHRGLLSLALLLLVPTLSACDDDEEVEVDPADALAFVELTMGGVTLRLNESGNPVSGGPLIVAVGATLPITARVLDEDGNDINSTLDDFELRGTSPTGVTFASTGDFTGTITGVTAGAGNIRFELFHVVEQHADWGPHDVAITVQ
jgi:hypothetical protein